MKVELLYKRHGSAADVCLLFFIIGVPIMCRSLYINNFKRKCILLFPEYTHILQTQCLKVAH